MGVGPIQASMTSSLPDYIYKELISKRGHLFHRYLGQGLRHILLQDVIHPIQLPWEMTTGPIGEAYKEYINRYLSIFLKCTGFHFIQGNL